MPNVFETNVLSYFPDEFKSHIRMTRQTFELFAQEVMTTGRIPIRNSSGRAPIPLAKQILAFLWSTANEERTRAVADGFNITLSSGELRRQLLIFQGDTSDGQIVSHVWFKLITCRSLVLVVAYLESLHSAILSLKAMYRRAVLGTTNLSNGKGNFGSTGPTGQSGPPSKLVPNIPVGPNRNGAFHLMYQPKLPEFGLNGKRRGETFEQ